MHSAGKTFLFCSLLVAAGPLCAAVPFRIGIAGYTFCKEGLDKGLDIMRRIDYHSLCHKDFFLPYDASDAAIKAYADRIYDVHVKNILLQDHSDSTVSFCNLKIREL